MRFPSINPTSPDQERVSASLSKEQMASTLQALRKELQERGNDMTKEERNKILQEILDLEEKSMEEEGLLDISEEDLEKVRHFTDSDEGLWTQTVNLHTNAANEESREEDKRIA